MVKIFNIQGRQHTLITKSGSTVCIDPNNNITIPENEVGDNILNAVKQGLIVIKKENKETPKIDKHKNNKLKNKEEE